MGLYIEPRGEINSKCPGIPDVTFGPVTPEFKRVVGSKPLIDQQFGYVCLAAPLLDLAGFTTEFCGAIRTQFCFNTIR